jgi:hypothetical protein
MKMMEEHVRFLLISSIADLPANPNPSQPKFSDDDASVGAGEQLEEKNYDSNQSLVKKKKKSKEHTGNLFKVFTGVFKQPGSDNELTMQLKLAISEVAC